MSIAASNRVSAVFNRNVQFPVVVDLQKVAGKSFRNSCGKKGCDASIEQLNLLGKNINRLSTISQNKRYIPHDLTTRFYTVQLYRNVHDVNFVIRRNHIWKASLVCWNKLYDGTKDSLKDNSHHHHTLHPNAHTPTEINM